MDGQADHKLIAHGRGDVITLTPAHIYLRGDLANTAAGTEEHRIHQAMNNAQFFYDQSPAESMEDKNQEPIRKQVQESMMTPSATHGNRDKKLMCQMPYLAYLCPLKGDRPDNFNPEKDQDKELFEYLTPKQLLV